MSIHVDPDKSLIKNKPLDITNMWVQLNKQVIKKKFRRYSALLNFPTELFANKFHSQAMSLIFVTLESTLARRLADLSLFFFKQTGSLC